MGRVYLCLGKTAEVPWYFERARVHIWNIEELCYFMQENAWILEPEVLNEKLAAWVGEQCGLPELAIQLYAATKEKEPVTSFADALFEYTGYCTNQQRRQVEKILRINTGSGQAQRAKARGDYFLECRKFVLAVREYEGLIREYKGMDPAFLGRVYHSLGTACARLFWFDRAADAFLQAYRLLRTKESALQFLAARRLGLGEQGYVAFLAENPDFYQLSLEFEKRMEACDLAWRESEDAAFILHAGKARRDGEGEQGRRLSQRLETLRNDYRSCTAQ